MKMIAAVLEQCGQPLQLLELEIPKLKRGQVLVRIAYSAICRSQLMEINGLRGDDKWLPHLLGHEASGVVVDVGAEVTKVKSGDEVILTWIKSSGIESITPHYSHNGKTINAGPITTFSNYSVVSENRVVLKPDGLDMDVAVLFGCALATGSGMVLNELKPSDGASVIVLGLGGVGMASLLTLVATGIRNILAVDSDPSKCELAKSFGVDVAVYQKTEHSISHIKSFFAGGADYCVEAGGSIESIELGFSLINSESGTLLFASHPPTGEFISLDPHQLISGKKIRGSWGGQFRPDSDVPTLSRLCCGNSLPLHKLIEDRFDLADINEAIDRFANGAAFRPILVMNHDAEIRS